MEEIVLNKEIGERIKAARMARGLSGRKLAMLAQLSPGYISNVELARHNMSIAALHRIAEALKVPIEKILGTDYNQGKKELTVSATSEEEQRVFDLIREVGRHDISVLLKLYDISKSGLEKNEIKFLSKVLSDALQLYKANLGGRNESECL